MSITATVTMVLVCGIVWGGFVVLLARAVWREGRKKQSVEDGVEDSQP